MNAPLTPRYSLYTRVGVCLSALFFLLLALSALKLDGLRVVHATGNAPAAQDEGQGPARRGAQPTPTPPEKSVVSGRAVYDDTGRPARRVRVAFVKDDGRTVPGVYTDTRGKFRLKGLGAGRYFVVVQAPGMLSPYSFSDARKVNRYGPPEIDADEARKHFEVVELDGMNEVELEVRARRGAAISGKVTYADGDAAINVTVNLMLRRKDGRLTHVFTDNGIGSIYGSRLTDDRGVYRVAGLPPGEYVVSVSEMIIHAENDNASMSMTDVAGSPLATTFYPSADSAKNATPIRLEAGQDAASIDITLAERPAFRLAGTARTRRGGRPLKHIRVRLRTKEELEDTSVASYEIYSPYSEDSRSTWTDEQGRWSFAEVPDGAYTLIAVALPLDEVDEDAGVSSGTYNANVSNMNSNMNSNMAAPAGVRRARRKRLIPKTQPVTVSGSDQTNVVLEMVEGITVSGKVTVEGDKPLPQAGIYVVAFGTPLNQSETASVMLEQSGNFVLEGVAPGSKINLGAFHIEEDKKFYLKSVMIKGRDMRDEPFDLGDATELEGVQIILSSEIGSLKGRILSAQNRRPLSRAPFLLIPAEPAEWRKQTRQLWGTTNTEGDFKIGGAPGDYLLMMFGKDEQPRLFNEQEIKERAATALRVTLRAGETKQIELLAPDSK